MVRIVPCSEKSCYPGASFFGAASASVLVNGDWRVDCRCVWYVVARRTSDGSTAMHVACMAGNADVLQWLVEAGGDLRLHDRDGKTPRDWAMRQSDAKRRRRVLDFIDWARDKSLADAPSAATSASKHVVELPAGLRFPFVFLLGSLLLRCSMDQAACVTDRQTVASVPRHCWGMGEGRAKSEGLVLSIHL